MSEPMPRIDLRPDYWDIVRDILRQHVPDRAVWAFGSRVTWTAKEYSDLDLAILGDEPLPLSASSALAEAFGESDLPFKVDVVDWGRASNGFRKVIEREYVVLAAAACPAWRKVSIGEVADIVGGGTPSTKNKQNFGGTIPWLTPKDLSRINDRYVGGGERNLSVQGLKNSSAKLLPAGSVLLSTRAPIGYVALAKHSVTTNQGFRNLVPREGALPEYLYYWLKLNTEELERHASGSTFLELSGSSLSGIQISLPPLPEQRAIAHILGTLDDKIELNRRMNATLEAMARAIFKDWFVDFGPTRAKMEGRSPYLPPELWNLFPDTLNDEGKPEGWTEKRLDSLFNVSIGRTPPRKEQHHFLPGGMGEPWLSIKTMGNIQTFADASEEDLTPDAVRRFRIPRIPAGTVMVSFKLTVGRVAIAAKDMYSNEAIAQLCAKRSTPVSYPFTYCYMKDFDFDRLGSTSSIATAINSKSIKTIYMMLPNQATHATFETITLPFFDRILCNSREIDALSDIRDRLLLKLISGEIRVRDAEKEMETLA